MLDNGDLNQRGIMKQYGLFVGAFLAALVLAVDPGFSDELKPGRRFQEADSDKDGKIHKQELIKYHMSRFETKDADKNGKVSPEEFIAFHEERFKILDVDKDGVLISDELDAWTVGMDSDRDGKLSLEEYLAFHKEFLKTLDKDKNGFLSGLEITTFHDERFDAIDSNSDNMLDMNEHGSAAALFHVRFKAKQGK